MARKNNTTPSASGATAAGMLSPHKMQLLVTVVNKAKAEFYADLLQEYEVNMQLILSARGTAASHTIEMLGLGDSERSVILSVIKRRRSAEALSMLEEKFKTVKGGKGIAYTIPMTSTIGVAIYQFLSNTKS